MGWDKVRLEYDPTDEMTYGTWRCPYCSMRFFGGGPVLHNEGCLKKVDYEEMVLTIGPKAVKRLLTGHPTLDGLTLETAKEKLPELFIEEEKQKD